MLNLFCYKLIKCFNFKSMEFRKNKTIRSFLVNTTHEPQYYLINNPVFTIQLNIADTGLYKTLKDTKTT